MDQPARRQLEGKTLSEVADWMYEKHANPAAQIAGQVEFLRRQTQAEQDASLAAQQTAEYTRQSARYMLWSVIALVLSALVTIAITFLKK